MTRQNGAVKGGQLTRSDDAPDSMKAVLREVGAPLSELWRERPDMLDARAKVRRSGATQQAIRTATDPLTCAGTPRQSHGPGLFGLNCCVPGMRGRGRRWGWCARARSLTLVRDPRVGSGVGDMMCDGVIPLGEALRPLSLSRPTTRTWRQGGAGSRPRGIGVSEGCARTGKLMPAGAPPRRARAACDSCA